MPTNYIPPLGGSPVFCPYKVAGYSPPLSNYLNVKDAPYSAYGDNVHDDAGAIGDCMAAAAAAGKDVYIPAGTYLLETQLQPPSHSCIRGAGVDTTILHATYYYGFQIINAYHNITISDMTIDGDDPRTSEIHGLEANEFDDVTLERVKFLDCRYGFKASVRGTNLNMDTVTAVGCGQNYISNTTGGTFTSCNFAVVTGTSPEGTSFHALYLCDNCHNLTFNTLTLSGGSNNADGYGHTLQWWDEDVASTYITFNNLTISAARPIVIGGANNLTFSTATITKTLADDQGVFQVDGTVDLLVENFTCSGGDGLIVLYGAGSFGTNCTFRDGTYTGPALSVANGGTFTNLDTSDHVTFIET